MMINPEFIHAYLDGELDPQQARQLGLWLLADPANQDRFDEEIDLVVGIIALTRRPKLNSSSSQRTTLRARTTSSNKFRARTRSSPSYWKIYASIAALMIICVSVALILTDKSSTSAINNVASTTAASTLPLFQIVGKVIIEREGKILNPSLGPIRELFIGDVVRSGANSTVEAMRIDLDNGQTKIHLDSDTSLVIRSIREPTERRGTSLDVHRGSLLVEAAPQSPETPLRLLSSRSNVEIVGTVVNFMVSPTKDHIAVGHGVVSVSPLSSTKVQGVLVSAGHYTINDGTSIQTKFIGAQTPTPVSSSSVVSISLIDDITHLPIPGFQNLTSGAVIDMAAFTGQKINLRANVRWASGEKTGHVVFHLDDQPPVAETTAPFDLYSNNSSPSGPQSTPSFTNGVHYIVSTPYTGTILQEGKARPLGGSGKPGHSATLIFTVINAP